MPHDTPLIATIVAGLGIALVLGLVASRLRLSPIVGYLLAGVAVGPHTPGFVGDPHLAAELSEIGVILLMFGVGLHFSLKDLLSVRRIAVPGALAQIGAATFMGVALAVVFGWSFDAGLMLGLALSVASTVVLLRALEERRILATERGKIAMGWLVVEDLVMVLVLVLVPAFAGVGGPSETSIVVTLFITLLEIGGFVALMLLVGRRAIPWILERVATRGSSEIFTLAVLSLSLGIAFVSAKIFGVSFALGAFFAGMVLNGSKLSHDAAERSLPLRDAFAVLFFVSVGMLFDPGVLVRQPLEVLAVCLVIIVGKSIVALGIVMAFGHTLRTGLTIAVSLAQIGEFSFILVGLGVELAILPTAGRDLVLAGAIVSITLNPMLFTALARLLPRLEKRGVYRPPEGHVIVVGHGGVGERVASELREAGQLVWVIDDDDQVVSALERAGVDAVHGNASADGVLELAHVASARLVIVAIPNTFEAVAVVTRARAANPEVQLLARAQSEAEAETLRARGVQATVLAEHEIARALARNALAI